MNFPTLRKWSFPYFGHFFKAFRQKGLQNDKNSFFFPETSLSSTFIVRLKIVKLKVRENYTINEKPCRQKRKVDESLPELIEDLSRVHTKRWLWLTELLFRLSYSNQFYSTMVMFTCAKIQIYYCRVVSEIKLCPIEW